MTDREHILQFFAWQHLPAHLAEVSRPFGDLADKIVETLPRNPERTVALRKLLESKDAAVRARVAKLEQIERSGHAFPRPEYQRDPGRFYRDVLRIDPVAVPLERRIAAVALWWYCSWPDARAIIATSSPERLARIWHELSSLRAQAGIDGAIGELARTGLRSADFREVKGFTAPDQCEEIAGIAGTRLLFITDAGSVRDIAAGNRASTDLVAFDGRGLVMRDGERVRDLVGGP